MTDTHLTQASSRGFRARLNSEIHSLAITGKVVFSILAIIFSLSTLSLLWSVNNFFMVEVPTHGGTITEGVLGLPRYINPVLAITDADKDITTLVYSGLMRQNADGNLTPDLAEKYSISDDGKTYTFTLKSQARFHDNTPVTADDVLYTIAQIQNPIVKSPRRANWEGVEVKKVDNSTIVFTLKQPYAPFIENTTIGIIPKHVWMDVTPEAFSLNDHNINPIGSGPYTLGSIKKNGLGVPVSYTLNSYKHFIFGRPAIDSIVFKFYSTESALQDAFRLGDIDSVNGLSSDAALGFSNMGASIYTSPLPRVFGIYFNQSSNDALKENAVRHALDISVDRSYIVNNVLGGFGTPLTGPMPQSFLGTSPAATSTSEASLNTASALLEKAGWKLNADGIREKKTDKGTTTLAFSISTSDAPELKNVAEIVRSQWKKIGVDVSIKVFESGTLNQDIIRPRKYDALLFGQIVNKDFDLYAFWHSSQRNDPGLNIALYSNPKVDTHLEHVRSISDPKERESEYGKLAEQIASDTPAVFLYSPEFVYITSSRVRNIAFNNVSAASERFNAVHTWYIDTERIWKVFASK